MHGLATADCATSKPRATDDIPLKCMVFNERLATSDNCKDRRGEVQSSSLKADEEGKENRKPNEKHLHSGILLTLACNSQLMILFLNENR